MWVLQLVQALELWEGTQDPVGQKAKDVMPKCIHPTPVLGPLLHVLSYHSEISLREHTWNGSPKVKK